MVVLDEQGNVFKRVTKTIYPWDDSDFEWSEEQIVAYNLGRSYAISYEESGKLLKQGIDEEKFAVGESWVSFEEAYQYARERYRGRS